MFQVLAGEDPGGPGPGLECGGKNFIRKSIGILSNKNWYISYTFILMLSSKVTNLEISMSSWIFSVRNACKM